MKAHELARALLKMPDVEITASVDLDPHLDSDGKRIFAYAIHDVIPSDDDITICFCEFYINDEDVKISIEKKQK